MSEPERPKCPSCKQFMTRKTVTMHGTQTVVYRCETPGCPMAQGH